MKTFLLWTVRVIAGLLAFVVLVYVGHGLWGMGQVQEAKGEAREDVRMLQRDTGTTDQIVKDNRAALGEPQRSWSQVVCEVGSNDSGWIVNDYTQRCSRLVVDVYASSVQQRAEDLGDRSQGVQVQECTTTTCLQPVTESSNKGFGSRVGTEPKWTKQDDVSEGSHTVVTVKGPESNSVLGCSPWGIVFCSAPVDHPVMPED